MAYIVTMHMTYEQLQEFRRLDLEYKSLFVEEVDEDEDTDGEDIGDTTDGEFSEDEEPNTSDDEFIDDSEA